MIPSVNLGKVGVALERDGAFSIIVPLLHFIVFIGVFMFRSLSGPIAVIAAIIVFSSVIDVACADTFYVSPTGDDRNSGTSESQPFGVVQHAIDRMQAGDTLVVLNGVYTGTLQLKSGITIKAKNPRRAVFSGLKQVKTSFREHAAGIYKADVNDSPKQLFYNDQPMTWARWPNAGWSENWIAEKKWANATEGSGPGVLTCLDFNEISSLDLDGGYCFLRYGRRNSCYSRRIESFDGKTLHWDETRFYSPRYTGQDGNKATPDVFPKLRKSFEYHPTNSLFFLAGAYDLLDDPGEWFVSDGTLFLCPPDGSNPNESVVLAKTVDYCIDQEEAVSDITIEGIDFLACSVRIKASENRNIRFENVHFKYINGEQLHRDRVRGDREAKPVQIAGSKLRIEECLFAGAMQSALRLTGEDLSVENCVFTENNRHATFERRPLTLYPTGNYRISRNTFFNNPSDAVRIVPDLDKMQSLNPTFSSNHIFNTGRYNTDASGVYFPSRSQRYAEVHHNWFHNINGNAVRLDISGTDLNVHHNVFWSSYRALSIEGYGSFNIYNNTAVHNKTPADLIRNVLSASTLSRLRSNPGVIDGIPGVELNFPPIDDWNVLNNLVEHFQDRIAPREKRTHNVQKKKGLLHPERDENWLIPIVDRGSIRGNLTGERRDVFTDGNLEGLNLIPITPRVRGGVVQTKDLAAQGVTSLGSYRGAYDVGDRYWYPGSDWMPDGLPVLKTMAEAERFANEHRTISIVPKVGVRGLPTGQLNQDGG